MPLYPCRQTRPHKLKRPFIDMLGSHSIQFSSRHPLCVSRSHPASLQDVGKDFPLLNCCCGSQDKQREESTSVQRPREVELRNALSRMGLSQDTDTYDIW